MRLTPKFSKTQILEQILKIFLKIFVLNRHIHLHTATEN